MSIFTENFLHELPKEIQKDIIKLSKIRKCNIIYTFYNEEICFINHLITTDINDKILKEEGEEWSFNEGCLSIPDVREDVYRNPVVTIEYCEEDFVMKTEVFDGLIARVIQHEYDHIEGILFTDKISSLKKRLIQKKLKNIIEGKTFQEYRMKFFGKKGR
jgi:peptide deformylase